MIGKDGTLRRYSTDTGAVEKDWPIPGATDVIQGPLAAGDMIAFATNDGRICAVGPDDKPLLWPAGGLIATPLVPVGSSAVVFGTTKRKVRCLSLRKGSVLWEVSLPDMATDCAVAAGRVAVFLCEDNRIRALGQDDGRSRWDRSVLAGTTLRASGQLLLVAGPRSVAMVEANWGHERWRRSIEPAAAEFWFSGKDVWLSGGDGALVRLDAETGNQSARLPLQGRVSSWCPGRTALVVSFEDGGLWCVKTDPLARNWYFKAPKPLSGVARGEGRVFAVVGGDSLVCFDQPD
jgi:outer membrane protein assembly factor BamB